MRIVVFTNIPTPYRIPFFEKLAHDPRASTHVYFSANTERNREWTLGSLDQGWATVLSGFAVTFGVRDKSALHVNRGIRRALDEAAPDVVVLGGYFSVTNLLVWREARRRGIPVVLWTGSTAAEETALRRVVSPVIRYLMGSADAVVAYGTRAGEYAVGLGAPAAGVFYAINSVDNDEYDAAAVNLAVSRGIDHGQDSDVLTLLFVGQLIRRKGLDLLIDALLEARLTRPVRLLVAGSGQEESALRLRSASLDVSWLGHLPAEGVRAAMVAADCVVLPSRTEVWGLVVNEAMALGTPVLASDACGATADLVHDGRTGFVFTSGDIPSLSNALRKVALASPAQLRAIGENARIRVRRVANFDVMVDAFIEAAGYALHGDSAFAAAPQC